MRDLVEKILSHNDLDEGEAGRLLAYMTDESTLDPILASAALGGLRAKGEAPSELRGFAMGLRERVVRPDIPEDAATVDVVGTGGDGSGSLNLSTGSALLAAAAGVPIVKHGNRSISSNSGSADVLAALGMDLPWDSHRAGAIFRETGFTFLFAPTFHPAMKVIGPVRQSLGVRTIFNLVGPLANPATPPFHVIGVFDLETAQRIADTVAGMPMKRTFVVHGDPGWDEPTPVGPYHLFQIADGEVRHTIEDPADTGIPRCSPGDLAGADPAHNAASLREALVGEAGAHRDALVLGASLAIRVADEDCSTSDAVERARTAVTEGKAAELLTRLEEVGGG